MGGEWSIAVFGELFKRTWPTASTAMTPIVCATWGWGWRASIVTIPFSPFWACCATPIQKLNNPGSLA
jgi:hypothetical protein